MTEQLYNQRTDLLRANTQLESRRRFTETVLSGVTAGVIGIDKEERIFLPNKSAIELLNLNIEKVVGKKFIKIIPEMSYLLKNHNVQHKIFHNNFLVCDYVDDYVDDYV